MFPPSAPLGREANATYTEVDLTRSPMRLATLLTTFLVLAPAPSAQTAQDFYPLDVGNEWVYRVDDFGEGFFQRDRITGTVTVEGVGYAQRERCDVPIVESGVGDADCADQLVRFTADGDLVVRRADGTEQQEICGLGRDDGAVVPCDDVTGGGGAALEIQRFGPATVRVGDSEVTASAVQAFEPVNVFIDPPPARYAAGIGRLAVFPFGGYQERFEYARVGDAEYGVNPLDPDPASFFPLAVGTVREYIDFRTFSSGPPARQDDVRTVALGGESWTLRRTQTQTFPGDGRRNRDETRRLFRYDETSATILERHADGTEVPLWIAPCGLEWPVGESECQGSPVYKRLAQTVEVGGEYRQTATLTLLTLEPAFILGAGLGLVYTEDGIIADVPLRYIDVGPLPTGDPLPLGTPFGDAFPTTPDPTPAELYYPLSVGDEWHTETGSFGVARAFQRRRVVGVEAVDGAAYAVVERSSATPENPAWSGQTTQLERVDPVSGFPITPDGERLADCPLDEPMNAELGGDVVLCNAGEGRAAFLFSGPLAQAGGPQIQTETYKTFEYVGLADGNSVTHYVPGVGPVPEDRPFGGGGSGYARLAYARVLQADGSTRTVGAPLPVAGDAAAPSAALALSASPNPTAGALRLSVTVPSAGALTVEAFDALGRRVYHAERQVAGDAEIAVDASAWAPGVYLVRARTADGVAAARVVRR